MAWLFRRPKEEATEAAGSGRCFTLTSLLLLLPLEPFDPGWGRAGGELAAACRRAAADATCAAASVPLLDKVRLSLAAPAVGAAAGCGGSAEGEAGAGLVNTAAIAASWSFGLVRAMRSSSSRVKLERGRGGTAWVTLAGAPLDALPRAEPGFSVAAAVRGVGVGSKGNWELVLKSPVAPAKGIRDLQKKKGVHS